MTRPQRFTVLAFWLALLLALFAAARLQEVSPLGLLGGWLERAPESPATPFVLLGAYLLRPLTLLPVTFLTVASGFIFGPVWGSLYALVATLLSSGLAYAIGRLFGAGGLETRGDFVARLRSRSFETVLLGRLLALPGDLINYASGFLRISFSAFLLATALGGAPGLLTGVLVGASVEGDLGAARVTINAPYLLASAGLLVVSLGVSYALRRRESKPLAP